MLLHANSLSIDVTPRPFSTFFRFFLESLSCVGVNVFILISGWYSIKFSIKRLLEFIFTVFFFSFLMFLVFQKDSENITALLDILLLKKPWFIPAYILLFAFSPVLNLFSNNANKRSFEIVLILYFILQTVLSYFGNSSWYSDGFSPIPFIGLYLLSSYIRRFSPSFISPKSSFRYMAFYLLISLIMSLVSITGLYYWGSGFRMFNYTNPLVIISSLCLFLSFVRLPRFHIGIINIVGTSSFAAFLIHFYPPFYHSVFLPSLSTLYHTLPFAVFIICGCCFFIAILLAGTLLDQFRILIWNHLTSNRKKCTELQS